MSVPKHGQWETDEWGAPARLDIPQRIVPEETRLIFLVLCLALEITILKFSLHPQAEGYGDRYAMLGRAAFPIALYFIIAMFLMNFGRMASLWQALVASNRGHAWRISMFLQLLSYALFMFAATHVMPTAIRGAVMADSDRQLPWDILFSVGAISTAMFSLAMLAPNDYWRAFFRKQKAALLIALTFSALGFGFGVCMQQSWDVLGEPTMKVSGMLLKLLYGQDVRIDLGAQLLGTSTFTVAIGYRCSGYEGMGMIVAFITWYLWNFGASFRFPAALFLYPVGVAVMWLFNALRITALIAIGSSISPELAKTGFHSNAGLISFVIVSFGIIWLTRQSRIFDRNEKALEIRIDSGNAMLIPFLVMLAATLICSALSTNFQWLYPLRAIATGWAIFLLWKKYEIAPGVRKTFPVFCGIAAFLMWIALIPPSSHDDQLFEKALFSAPAGIVLFWIAFRFLGSVLIVPIAEELAFRGYLFDLLGIDERKRWRHEGARWLAVFAISLAFGLLHGYWIAATMAGMFYGAVRLRSGRIEDAIIAHVTTNLLLSLYVFGARHWSYWQ